jgi:uncharacterized protein (TIGR04255 family)
MTVNSEYPKLFRQPLTLVLAEFRFDHLALEPGPVSAFGSALGETFPALREAVTQQVEVDGNSVKVRLVPVFRGMDPDRGQYLHLDPGRVVYATTQYPRFAGFSEVCAQMLAAAQGVLAPRELVRVGLRYNDAVVPEPGESLADYLQSPLAPPVGSLADGQRFVRYLSETVLQTEVGLLVARALMGRHGLRTMPDLEGQFGLPAEGEIPMDRVTAVLDFDHYWQAPESGLEAFSPEVAMTQLALLHGPAREAFWTMTTDFARSERWN